MDGFDLPMSFGKRKAAPASSAAKAKAPPHPPEPPQALRPAAVKRPLDEVDDVEAAPGPSKVPSRSIDSESAATAAPGPSTKNARGIVDDEDDYDSDQSDEKQDELEDEFPISESVSLKDHSKVVSALSVDSSGARVATGSHDYDVKMWDFGGMDNRLRPFKSFEPSGNYHIHDVAFSPDGKVLLVIPGTTQPKIYTREGEDGLIFPKGDPYIRDMKHTKGHVADMTAGCWNSTTSQEFITSSNDTTIRLWNTEDRTKHKNVIVVKSKDRGARTKVTACAYSWDAKLIAGACTDGTFHLWASNSNFVRPSLSNEQAHVKGSETSGIAFARDGKHVATRGGDDTVKLWDVRKLRQPVAIAEDLANLYPETNLVFSPDDRSILTGLSVRAGGKGEIAVLDREGLSVKRRIPVGDGSVVKVAWHARINQIFATTSTGTCQVMYSPSRSHNGALLPLAKTVRTKPRQDAYIADAGMQIITPDALPMYRDESYYESKQKQAKARKDPVLSHKPQEPVVGKGSGGRIGSSMQQALVQHMFRNTMVDEDPREALLKYADNSDPVFTAAWQKTQPKPIFSEPLPDQQHKKDDGRKS